MPPLDWLGDFIIILFLFGMPPLGWLGVMIIVLFFVRVLPLGWLGDIIIILLSLPSMCVYSSVFVCLMFCKLGFNGEPYLKALHSLPWVELDG